MVVRSALLKHVETGSGELLRKKQLFGETGKGPILVKVDVTAFVFGKASPFTPPYFDKTPTSKSMDHVEGVPGVNGGRFKSPVPTLPRNSMATESQVPHRYSKKIVYPAFRRPIFTARALSLHHQIYFSGSALAAAEGKREKEGTSKGQPCKWA